VVKQGWDHPSDLSEYERIYTMKQIIYPFSAIVGQEQMKTALLLNAVDPGIGGVLISGHKGTGKSTAARALAHILPQVESVADCPYRCPVHEPSVMCASCLQRTNKEESMPVVKRTMPMVELPLSATEDRVVGTLHVEHALKTGQRRFEPGLMAAANGGILYIDEVNLLDDHLVDILLDAAASGVNVVEREGVSHIHPARFMLVGTMNPEEGELRPQFLDRFGLSLSVESVTDTRLRQTIARRRIGFDQNPQSFADQWTESEAILSRQIALARSALGHIQISNAMIDLAVRLSAAVEAQGHRAEIAILKTAKAMAALLEKSDVEKVHIAEAARLVLPHRITNMALSTPGKRRQKVEEVLKAALDSPSTADQSSDQLSAQASAQASAQGADEDWDDISTQVPGSCAASNTDMLFSFLEEKKKRFLTPMN
jgi:Mg-chelatase subunit ChlI